jgi:hypothetical protein
MPRGEGHSYGQRLIELSFLILLAVLFSWNNRFWCCRELIRSLLGINCSKDLFVMPWPSDKFAAKFGRHHLTVNRGKHGSKHQRCGLRYWCSTIAKCWNIPHERGWSGEHWRRALPTGPKPKTDYSLKFEAGPPQQEYLSFKLRIPRITDPNLPVYRALYYS